MKKMQFLSAGLFLMFVFACNSAADESADTAGDSTGAAMDTSHAHTEISSIQPLPDIPAGATVSFKNLKDGQTVSSPVEVEMVAENISVDTAGAIKANSGHHHILVDAGDSMAAGEVIPMDSTHLHFGKAQKQAEVKLAPGKHKLTLQFADGIHRSYGAKMAKSVTVTVK